MESSPVRAVPLIILKLDFTITVDHNLSANATSLSYLPSTFTMKKYLLSINHAHDDNYVFAKGELNRNLTQIAIDHLKSSWYEQSRTTIMKDDYDIEKEI